MGAVHGGAPPRFLGLVGGLVPELLSLMRHHLSGTASADEATTARAGGPPS
jgi:hypothetical protein